MPTPDDENKQDDLRSTLEAAFAEKVSNPDTPKEPEPVGDAGAPPASDKPAAPAAADDKSKPAAGAAAPAAKPNRVAAPARWTKEEKEEWDQEPEGVDEKTAAYVAKMKGILINRNRSLEAEFTRQSQANAADRQYKSSIEPMLAPYRQQYNITDQEALKQLISGFEHSNRDPAGFIQWIAQQRGVDLRALAQRIYPQQPQTAAAAGKPSEQQVQLHPDVQRQFDELRQENIRLQQQLGGQVHQVQQHIQGQQRAEAERINAEAAQTVQQFMDATDEAGNSKYPFARDVQQHMSSLIRSGAANTLEDAYDQAVYANPKTRQKLMESRDLEQRRSFEQRLRDDAARARGAAGGLTGAAPITTEPPAGAPAPVGSIRETLEIELAARRAGTARRI